MGALAAKIEGAARTQEMSQTMASSLPALKTAMKQMDSLGVSISFIGNLTFLFALGWCQHCRVRKSLWGYWSKDWRNWCCPWECILGIYFSGRSRFLTLRNSERGRNEDGRWNARSWKRSNCKPCLGSKRERGWRNAGKTWPAQERVTNDWSNQSMEIIIT